MYTLYVIPGSHACRSAMLMLEHKQVPYRRVDIVPLLHPLVVRLHGFDAGGQTRIAGERRTLALRLGDRVGTVPALAASGSRPTTGSHASWTTVTRSRRSSRQIPSDGRRSRRPSVGRTKRFRWPP